MHIHFLSIPAYNNFNSLKEFYNIVFGWTITNIEGHTNLAKVIEKNILIGEVDGSSSTYCAGLGVAPCIEVSDIDTVLENVENYGGTIEKEKTEFPGDDTIYTARFIDPAGNRVGLYEI